MKVLIILLAGLVIAVIGKQAHARQIHTWLPGLMRSYFVNPKPKGRPIHVMFCFVDHFEPRWGRADYDTERRRVREWCEGYPRLCDGHVDADGKAPQHTFFFPEEEYRAEHIEDIVELCRAGYGELEIHLHHDNDTADGLREKLRRFVGLLSDQFGAVPVDPSTGKPRWAFVHGNWALDNSRPDGRWCGVNNELIVLAEEGCYADFTLPSAPDATQTATVNAVYYATDDPGKPKSHDRGEFVRVGGNETGDLMIIQGPLGLNWKWRKYGILPRIENADVRRSCPPRRDRTDLWVRSGIHVQGKPDWVFVKVHTHGTQESDMGTLLGEPVGQMFSDLETRYNDGDKYVLHYVTAREMYNIIKAAEAGEKGNPGEFRDYLIPPPSFNKKGTKPSP